MSKINAVSQFSRKSSNASIRDLEDAYVVDRKSIGKLKMKALSGMMGRKNSKPPQEDRVRKGLNRTKILALTTFTKQGKKEVQYVEVSSESDDDSEENSENESDNNEIEAADIENEERNEKNEKNEKKPDKVIEVTKDPTSKVESEKIQKPTETEVMEAIMKEPDVEDKVGFYN